MVDGTIQVDVERRKNNEEREEWQSEGGRVRRRRGHETMDGEVMGEGSNDVMAWAECKEAVENGLVEVVACDELSEERRSIPTRRRSHHHDVSIVEEVAAIEPRPRADRAADRAADVAVWIVDEVVDIEGKQRPRHGAVVEVVEDALIVEHDEGHDERAHGGLEAARAAVQAQLGDEAGTAVTEVPLSAQVGLNKIRCGVCYSIFQVNKCGCYQCGHMICVSCAESWSSQKTCPFCRKEAGAFRLLFNA